MNSIFEDNKVEKGQTVPRTIGEQPGGLRSDTRMTIQTRQAQKLVIGRRKGKGKKIIRGKEVIVDVQSIIGLLDFGRRMKLLWLSAQADDPYADWYLLQIETAINEAKKLMTEKKQWLDEVLNSMDGFEIDVARSIEPIQVPIVFQNPYGYMGAYLVADYDALCCSVFTAGHIGLIDRKTAHSLTEIAGKSVRRTFNLATKWKFTGVTRDDIKDKNPTAENASDTHGECPEPILAKTKRAKISPEIREKKKPVVVTIITSKEGNVEQIKPAESEDKKESDQKKTGTDELFGLA